MCGEVILAGWSLCGLLWLAISCWLVVADAKRTQPAPPPATKSDGMLSIFKPLPPLGPSGLSPYARGLESFAAQLDETSEMLLGAHEADSAAVSNFAGQLKVRYPQARITVVSRSEPDDVANPKVAWEKILASRARGDVWLWSDADNVAPEGYLRQARSEFSASGAGMLTSPYTVAEASSAPAFLDALFVNVEFFPGVLLLRRFGPVDFGFGAATFFRRADFAAKVDWHELGAALADDCHLGGKLRPVQIGTGRLTTVAEVSGWWDAILHYLRWSKTVRWNRPGGTEARILVLPVLGWLVAAGLHPFSGWAWLGLLGMIQAEVLAAAFICQRLGCRVGARDLLTLEAWSIGRILVWILCWFRWPVNWRGQQWNGPYLIHEK